jgi:hypothetical protein
MDYIKQTEQWLEHFVIALNLCPFASVPFKKGQVRLVLEESEDPDVLVNTFLQELNYLYQTDPAKTETTLIVHPNVLTDFLDYNDFLGVAEDLLEDAALSGILQIASFHPKYQFAGSPVDDPANYTNRSPFPMLHLLREDSISKAVDHFPDPERIPEVNMERLRRMGVEKIKACWKQ